MHGHITYEELLEITSWGIFSMNMKGIQVTDKRLKPCLPKKIKNALHEGIYTGSPGKDIYLMLPYLSSERMQEVAFLLSKNFPKVPPSNHVNVAACVRFIYGQFEKQGILRSKKDFERMKKEKLNWDLPRKFLKFLYKELENSNNFYGLNILYEMEAHRLGDEAVLYKSKEKLKEMEKTYDKAIESAYKCKSYKHMFSLYYWAGRYFAEFGESKKTIKYYKMAILKSCKYYHKYYPVGDSYYCKRLLNSLSYIKKNDTKNWDSFHKKYKNKIKSDKLKRVFEKIRKK